MLVNAYCTHRSPPPLDFPHRLLSRRDRSDPELGPHLNGLMGFVMDRGNRPMTSTRYAVLRHAERVRHHLALEVEDAHMDAFAHWATVANAIVFLPDATLRAPSGKVLVDPRTGDPAPGALVPYPVDAFRRKTVTEQALGARGLRSPPSLPPVVSEVEVELRDPAEVVRRCFALLACAVRGESLGSGDPLPSAEILERLPLAAGALSAKERVFLEAPSPARQDVITFTWGYEPLAALAWSVGLLPELPFPAAICDVPHLARTMFQLDGPAFASQAALRSTPSILDALDLHFRVHWITTEARRKGTAPPAGIEPGVVMERHRALNWLARFEDTSWDDVQTPT